MMQGIFAYGGTNNRRTLLSVVVLFVASVLLVMPYYFVYRAVTVLLDGGRIFAWVYSRARPHHWWFDDCADGALYEGA